VSAEQIRVDENEFELDHNQLILWNGAIFTGVGVETLADGTLHAETEYVDGLKQGISTIWHDNGQLAERKTHWRGQPHGREQGWDRQGRLVYEELFELGYLVSAVFFNPEDGTETRRWTIPADDRGLLSARTAYGKTAPAIE